MPKIAKELGALEVSRLNTVGFHAVGVIAGLGLQITKTGARSWILRKKVGNKRPEIGLGAYPAVTLAQARDKARAVIEKIESGVDPVAEKRENRMALKNAQSRLTFEKCASKYIESHEVEWRNSKHASQWRNTIKTYANPVIGNLYPSEITNIHIMNILEPIWLTKNETAVRLRGRLEQILDWAKVQNMRSGENPAAWKGNLSQLLPAPSKVQKPKPFASLDYYRIGEFMVKLRKEGAIGAKALELAILTGGRASQIIGATWDEFDLKIGVWTIRGDRMKNGDYHTVPLSRQAMELISELKGIRSNEYLFAGRRGKTISDGTMNKYHFDYLDKDDGERKITVHGFRSTFRSWAAAKTSHSFEAMEKALAHCERDKTVRAYQRDDLIEKHMRLMKDWADYCDAIHEKTDDVIPLWQSIDLASA